MHLDNRPGFSAGAEIEVISALVRGSFLCWFTTGLLNTQGLPRAEVAGVITMMMTGEEKSEQEGKRKVK